MSLIDIMWKLVNYSIPLANDDFETYLTKDGTITEEGLNLWKDAIKAIREAYSKIDKGDKQSSFKLLSQALEKLNSIKSNKPLPPDAKVRFEEVKNNVSKAIELLKS
ncbi:hypothetical protein [Sulfolobus acidocaldarius]|uniref:Conserved protein n=4 Tax=Sulfolobus acidocaldarius TaxID=2285 RepID=Q4JBI6_SULAC|nr:hypothetical protein [Sulfolobus acidocaldarius]AAY79843.1 conserved protein [Sulfolobus acidocaldarius DSM 639]AGE70404.1 hypothetical protein SacN8_02115 [Sulfolobus acidocaldarius N8]AGE72678.1 hypothetical protein SacRon12I_02110 [Sulfolobus acidocaldarius Ron12/I]ALU29204.1 hypothetical protein ATY89_04145 [Sulfolobus acidocaldarius]ALU31931.1 hypothetical protein ATZ20_07170 [Sulfolobus acidocaldarius]